MKRWTYLIVFSIALSSTSCGQDYEAGQFKKVVPGDPMLDSSTLQPHTVTYKQKSREMYYALSKVQEETRELWLLQISFPQSPAIDSLYFDARDLSYVSRHLMNLSSGYRMSVRMIGNEMTTQLTALPESDWDLEGTFTHTYPHGFFEIAVMNYFIKALPLQDGLKVSMPYFLFSRSQDFKVHWLDVVVEGQETLTIDGENYETWKVSSLAETSGKTFWISEAYPFALKIHSHGIRPWTISGAF